MSSAEPDDENREPAEFEKVDWEQVGGLRQYITLSRLVLVAGLFAVADLYNYHQSTGDVYLVMKYEAGLDDWLLMISLVVLCAYGVLPLLRRPRRLKRLLGRLWGRWATMVSLGVLAGVLAVGIWALLRGFLPLSTLVTGDSFDTSQPPVWAEVPMQLIGDCAGETTTTDAGRGFCQGSWQYPLGTDSSAYELTDLLIMGTKPVVYAILIPAGLIVPLATFVGITAGYVGGLLDDLLMAYVDIQLSIPAVVIYLFSYTLLLNNSKGMFIVAFGLLSWGGIARIVRSETLQHREKGYVRSARAVGASRLYVMRRHILPSVTNSVIPAMFQLISLIILTEAGLAFLGFEPFTQTWGQTVRNGLGVEHPTKIWWTSTIPALTLMVTVLACKVAGDGLRDVLDPRGGR